MSISSNGSSLYMQAHTTALQGWERGTPYIWSTMPGAPAAAAPVAAHCLGGLARGGIAHGLESASHRASHARGKVTLGGRRSSDEQTEQASVRTEDGRGPAEPGPGTTCHMLTGGTRGTSPQHTQTLVPFTHKQSRKRPANDLAQLVLVPDCQPQVGLNGDVPNADGSSRSDLSMAGEGSMYTLGSPSQVLLDQ